MQQVQSRLNIIFIAFLFSSFVYLIVGFALTRSGWKPILQENLHLILSGLFLVISIALMGIVFKMKTRLATQTTDQETVVSKSIVLFALSEVPAILGLVLFFLTGEFLYLAVLCAISILSFLLVKPRS